MTRVAYINGRYVNSAQAHTNIEDRGYQFADGIYEYFAFFNRKLLDAEPHLIRLERSLAELSIPTPMSMQALRFCMEELIARNALQDGGLYLQITRGVARRDHPFPKATKPVLSMTVCGPKVAKPQERENGVKIITQPDIRWSRCDIKSVGLLANVLAKQQASSQGAREAWLFKPNGTITEGAVSNAFIVTEEGIITHPKDHHILGGVAREATLTLARDAGMSVHERPFTLAEAKAAREAFITSTSANVLPVTTIDGAPVGNGKPGPVTLRLMELFHHHIADQTGKLI